MFRRYNKRWVTTGDTMNILAFAILFKRCYCSMSELAILRSSIVTVKLVCVKETEAIGFGEVCIKMASKCRCMLQITKKNASTGKDSSLPSLHATEHLVCTFLARLLLPVCYWLALWLNFSFVLPKQCLPCRFAS